MMLSEHKSFRCIQNPPCCTFKACPAAKRIPRSPPHGGHPGVSFPLFAPTRHRSFHHFTPPPPIHFSIAIIYKVSPFYLFTFCRAGNAKTPCPCQKNTARLLRQTVCAKALCSFVRKSSPDCSRLILHGAHRFSPEDTRNTGSC